MLQNFKLTTSVFSLTGLFFITCLPVLSQDYDFIFNETKNQTVVKSEGKSPYVYELIAEKFIAADTVKYVKRITPFYQKTLLYKDLAQDDSIKIVKLKQASQPIINLDEADVNKRLEVYRRTLKRVNKYELIPTASNPFYKLKIRRNIFKPEQVILGRFKALGLFYVIKNVAGLTECNLIPVEEAKENNITEDQFLFKNKFVVMQNLHTKVYYMVFPDFIKNYPVKVSNNIKT
ncbi:hypothetical protein PW52_05550 [Tamlana sedimentorum]|uniref:Uncharacterized protein n=1 Tax=Neotamlana sedimentorum TaxID=1435349 RepID=A0A0D7WEB3_9FLAO|nr:hypothetical protein [Tamlana sedimentorum]KJD36082.1 hypothetical protein PW52_05550 [Tamlana sedimentorum]